MNNVTLVDYEERDHLLPFTFTRPVAAIRVGIFTITEKWQKRFGCEVSYDGPDYLSAVYPYQSHDFRVNGAVIPTAELVQEISNLKPGEALWKDEVWIASNRVEDVSQAQKVLCNLEVARIDRPWKIFQLNGWAMKEDFGWLRSQVKTTSLPDDVVVRGSDILVEEGAVIQPCIINAETGPVYIAKGAEVMEGCTIRGGLALMGGSQLKMGAKIYGPTTIGPHSKVGGEVNNAVFFGYSNKGHDGFVGNSVIGEWCNLGADTNTSNLKNNYATVKIHSYALGRSESTGGQFCGLMMGDHAKSGINTMFNTGTVCGIFANVFGAGFPHRRIPDFGWGGADGFKDFRLAEALEVAEKVMERRHVDLTEQWKQVYSYLYDQLSMSK